MSKEFPKCVIVIVGKGREEPKNPDWKNKGSVWFVESQSDLDKRIFQERNVFANAYYDEKNDDGQEWCEIVWSTTHYLCEDFDQQKHFKL